jgi:hypothetical protein
MATVALEILLRIGRSTGAEVLGQRLERSKAAAGGWWRFLAVGQSKRLQVCTTETSRNKGSRPQAYSSYQESGCLRHFDLGKR